MHNIRLHYAHMRIMYKYMNYQQAKERAKVLKALAHPMRILIIDALHKNDLCVSDLCALGTINQSNVSRY